MNCEILRTLYIRSHGDVPCDDDAGESIIRGHVPLAEPQWNIGTLFGKETYTHIRESFRSGTMPWPGGCPQCAWCDGFFPANYAKYRVGGDVERVIRFIKDAPTEIGGKRQAPSLSRSTSLTSLRTRPLTFSATCARSWSSSG